ncbi:MAG: MBOAT family O-acyltransferase [Pseudobdellovibrio sp.]
MSFTSTAYYLFLALTAILYFQVPNRFKIYVLLVASYVFYLSFDPRYVVFILATTFVSYLAAQFMQKTNKRSLRFLALIATLSFEFCLLFTTKYWNNLSIATNWLNPINIIVPLGISFYTFQTVGYIFDVYRKQILPEKSIVNYAAFLSFFPHLLAGPIEPAQSFLPQIQNPVKFNYEQMAFGILLICVGLFKKLVIADMIAPVVDIVFQNPTQHFGSGIALTAFFARYQIYCDFSGYTDIAIGSAQILGFKLMQNFDRPFFSTSITQYWQKWHISLSLWIRTYIFYPLVSTSIARIGVHGLVLLTFLILGLWHGGTFNFLAYGLWHGVFVVLDSATRGLRQNVYAKFKINSSSGLFKTIAICFTFFLIVAPPTILFRSPNWSTSLTLLNNLSFTWSWQQLDYLSSSLVLMSYFKIFIVAVVFLELTHYLQLRFKFMQSIWQRSPLIFWGLVVSLLLTIAFFGVYAQESRFIYTQF